MGNHMSERLSAGKAVSETAETDDLEALVGAITKVGFCRSPSFSPDGKQIAFISDLNGIPQIWTVSVYGGWPNLVTSFNDPVESVSWSPEGAWLALSLAINGGNKQVYLVRPDGSNLRRLTDGGSENNFMGAWAYDGRTLAISSTRRSLVSADAYIVDVVTGKLTLVTENRGLGGFIDFSRDGRYGLLYRLIHRGDDDLFLVDLTNGNETLLTEHEGPGSFYGKFSPCGKIVYLRSDKDRDRAAFAKIVLDYDNRPGAIEVIADREDAILEAYQIDECGVTAALVWNVAGRNELTFFDLMSNKHMPGPKLPGETVSDLQFSKDGSLLVMRVQDAAAPSDIWVLNLQTGNFNQVTRSPHAGVNIAEMIRPRLIRFLAHDNVELTGWLYVPQNRPSPGPCVLSFHGGPEAQERPVFDSTYQAVLTRGIAVFAPNVRGSSGFGKRFINLDNGPLRENAIRDIKTCADYVISAGVADPQKIGIIGGSYGGYMVMAGLTEYPELFAAGANLYGIVNFETFLARTQPWMAAISRVKYGDPETQLEMLRKLSPIHKLDQIVAPVIVLHGANDTNVPVIEAEQVVNKLRGCGVPVEYVLFDDEGHGFFKVSNRIRSTVSIVRWFEIYLKAGLRQFSNE